MPPLNIHHRASHSYTPFKDPHPTHTFIYLKNVFTPLVISQPLPHLPPAAPLTGCEWERRRNATGPANRFPPAAAARGGGGGGGATGEEGAEGCEGTALSPTHGNRETAVVGGRGRTCDPEERGQAEERGGLLVGRGTLGDAFLYERQAVRAQANWETREGGGVRHVAVQLESLHIPCNHKTQGRKRHHNLIITRVDANVIIYVCV